MSKEETLTQREAFQAILIRLSSVKAAVSCAARVLITSDSHDGDEDVCHVETLLRDTVAAVDQLQEQLDRFETAHLRNHTQVAS